MPTLSIPSPAVRDGGAPALHRRRQAEKIGRVTRNPPRQPKAAPAEDLPGLLTPAELAIDRQFSMNLSRGLEVLRAFTPDEPVLGNSELVERTGLPRSTVSRLTYTLLMLGYLSRAGTFNKYRLGAGVLSLAHPMLACLQARQVARHFMEPLSARTGCTVNLGMRDRLQVVYVDSCRADSANTYLPDIGSTRPLLTSSIGRALILGSPRAEAEAIMNRLRVDDPEEFTRSWPLWLKDAKHFDARGFCLSLGEWRSDVYAVAAPIRQPGRGDGLALNCTISVHRLGGKDEMTRTVAPLMLEAVREIESALGLSGGSGRSDHWSKRP